MNYYHMWVNLKDGHRDLEFAANVKAYLDHLKSHNRIESWSLTRRKFGFSPDHMGEFHIVVHAKDLAQLDSAFSMVATRDGTVEQLVWREQRLRNLKGLAIRSRQRSQSKSKST